MDQFAIGIGRVICHLLYEFGLYTWFSGQCAEPRSIGYKLMLFCFLLSAAGLYAVTGVSADPKPVKRDHL